MVVLSAICAFNHCNQRLCVIVEADRYFYTLMPDIHDRKHLDQMRQFLHQPISPLKPLWYCYAQLRVHLVC